jgi:hypothetical protein
VTLLPRISQPDQTPLFSAKKLLRMLTERFFLYRLVVFCPEQTKTSTANENSSNEEQQTVEGPKNWKAIRVNQVGTAGEALLGLFRYQAKQAKFLWSVERMTHRGLPDNSIRFGGGPWLRNKLIRNSSPTDGA